MVIPGFSEREIGIGDDTPDILSKILGTSNRKNHYTRYIKNMQQPASINLNFREGKT